MPKTIIVIHSIDSEMFSIRSPRRNLCVDLISQRDFVKIGQSHFSIIDNNFISLNDRYRFLSNLYFQFSKRISLFLLEMCDLKTKDDQVRINQIESFLCESDIKSIEYILSVELE
jgi:hypothetical protein